MTLVAAGVGGGIALIDERTLWLPVLAGGATFITWALGRELDPDHQWTAMAAAAGAGTVVLLGSPLNLLVLASLLVAARLVVATTGRRPLVSDLIGIVALAAATSYTALGWVAGFTVAVAIFLDDRMEEAPTRPGILAAGAASVATTLVVTLTDAIPDTLPPIHPGLVATTGALALIAVAREPAAPVSLVDSRKKTPIRADRLQVGRVMTGIALFAGSILDPGRAPVIWVASAVLGLAIATDLWVVLRRRSG